MVISIDALRLDFQSPECLDYETVQRYVLEIEDGRGVATSLLDAANTQLAVREKIRSRLVVPYSASLGVVRQKKSALKRADPWPFDAALSGWIKDQGCFVTHANRLCSVLAQ